MMIRCFFLILLSSAGFHAPAQHKKEQLRSDLDSFIRANFRDTEPGGSLMVRKGDEILYSRSFGLADLASGEKFSSATVSNTGSISKTFVAYGILILQQQGKLSIEDPIIKYHLPFLSNMMGPST